jgi:hypothetical protein
MAAEPLSETNYRSMVDAVLEQRHELFGEQDLIAQWDSRARAFRFYPRRELEPNLAVIASLVHPADEVLDVGGGAGRVGLPLALRCKSLVNVEPSRSMGTQFLASARAARIRNVQLVAQSWLGAAELAADLVVVADVTYFITDIGEFVQKLCRSARRRVCIWIWSVPPPNRHARLFQLVHGSPQAPVPGHRELLHVLWDAGLLPDVQLLPEAFDWPERLPRTRPEAVKFALERVGGRGDAAAARVESALDKLFTHAGRLYRPTWRPSSAGLLITWSS